jgi:hypothetical protein
MKLNQSRTLPADLLQAANRLAKWRQQRVRGERIPEPLWNLVLAAARQHGVNRTATITGIGYYELKKRLAATPASSNPQLTAKAPFVELPPPTAMRSAVPSTPTSECRLEWEQPAGAKVRLQWTGSPPDLIAIIRSLREAE